MVEILRNSIRFPIYILTIYLSLSIPYLILHGYISGHEYENIISGIELNAYIILWLCGFAYVGTVIAKLIIKYGKLMEWVFIPIFTLISFFIGIGISLFDGYFTRTLQSDIVFGCILGVLGLVTSSLFFTLRKIKFRK